MIIRDLVAQIRFTAETAPIDKADRKVDSLKQTLGGLKTAAVGAFAALGGARVLSELSEAVDVSLAYGEALGKIQSIVQDNAPRMREYKNAISDMALSTGRSVGELAEAAYQVVSTYGDTADTFAQLNTATKIGIAGNATAAEGIRLLSAVTRAYGDTSAAAQQKVADLAFQTVNLGVIEIPEMTASIGQATPMAKALGVSLEELFAIIASLSGVTGNGSEVMTQMDSAMRSLLKKTPEMEHAFKKLHVKTAQQLIATYGLTGGFRKLVAQTDGTQEGMERLFGRIEGLKAMLQLTGAGAQDFDDKLGAMKDVAGATDAAVRNMTTGYGANAFAAKKAQEKTAALRREVGEEFVGAWGKARDEMIDFSAQFWKQIQPVFESWDTNLDGMNRKTESYSTTVHALAYEFMALELVLEGIASAFSFVALGAQQVAASAKIGTAVLFGDKKHEIEGRMELGQLNADFRTDNAERVQRMKRISTTMLDPDYARNLMETARLAREQSEDALHEKKVRAKFEPRIAAAAAKGDISGGQTIIKEMNVALHVPEGTPQEQQRQFVQIAERAVRSELRRAAADVTLKTDTGVTEQFGAEGTNSMFSPAEVKAAMAAQGGN